MNKNQVIRELKIVNVRLGAIYDALPWTRKQSDMRVIVSDIGALRMKIAACIEELELPE